MPVGTISSSADTVGVGVINYRVPVCETHEEVIANCQCVGGQGASCWGGGPRGIMLGFSAGCALHEWVGRWLLPTLRPLPPPPPPPPPCSKIADTVAGMKRGYPGLDLSEPIAAGCPGEGEGGRLGKARGRLLCPPHNARSHTHPSAHPHPTVIFPEYSTQVGRSVRLFRCLLCRCCALADAFHLQLQQPPAPHHASAHAGIPPHQVGRLHHHHRRP